LRCDPSRGDALDHVVDESVTQNTFGLGFEIEDKTMTQGRQSHGYDVLDGHVKPTVHERSGFGGEHDALSAARARSVGDIPTDNFWSRFRRGMGRVDEIDDHLR